MQEKGGQFTKDIESVNLFQTKIKNMENSMNESSP